MGSAGSEQYCLRWNNHQSNLLGVFSQLLRDESLVDVTLACSEGHSIRAHKVVLSACSSYFRALFVDHPARHPIVILKDVRFAELRTLVDFMYKGEVNVEYAHLSALLKTAESLKVKGLAEMTRDYAKSEPEQTEPQELVGRRPPPSPPQLDDADSMHSPADEAQNLRVCKSPAADCAKQPPPPAAPRLSPRLSPRTQPPSSPPVVAADCGPSDMSIHGGGAPTAPSAPTTPAPPLQLPPPPPAPTLAPQAAPVICHRSASSPLLNCEPLPGPSNMPPVQQVPLSLKKEVDWGGGDEKPQGESSSDYSRHPHDSISDGDRCIGSPVLDRPSSTQSSRSSTPFALPFPTLPTSLLEVGLMHPALLGDEMFRCTACMAAFPSLWLLEQHTALQHIGSIDHLSGSIDKPFVCEQCGQSYRYRSAYVKHREQNHRARLPADKLFSCDVCGMQFRYLKSFKKHRLNHALEKLHGKSAENLPREPRERSRDRNSGPSDLEDEPNREMDMESSDHVSSSNETLAVEDNDTGVVIKKEREEPGEGTSSDAERPDADQDDTIDSIGTFPFASGGSGAAELLRGAHESSIMNFLRADSAERQRERRFACPFCGKCVRSKENLKLHVRKHTGERPFVCLFCGRAFGGKSDLTRHLRIHTGERPYHCDMCGKCFARADYLSKHLTTHINTPR